MVRDDTTVPIVQVRRRVRASADQIFDLWTKPDLMVRWMSPFPGAVHCKASCDLRPGGAFSLVMSSKESIREVSGTYWLGKYIGPPGGRGFKRLLVRSRAIRRVIGPVVDFRNIPRYITRYIHDDRYII